jgi:hypothetical protein
MVHTLRPILIMKTYQWFQMQLYCNLCNYIATIFSNIGEWSNATILHLMQLYATILQLYATILQQIRMQLYATMQLCNYMQLMQLKQLYGTYATLCNFMQQLYATLCNLCNYATICNLCNYNYMQLYDG